MNLRWTASRRLPPGQLQYYSETDVFMYSIGEIETIDCGISGFANNAPPTTHCNREESDNHHVRTTPAGHHSIRPRGGRVHRLQVLQRPQEDRRQHQQEPSCKLES